MPWQDPAISVCFKYAGLHCWPMAPESHAFLRHPHRHIFECSAEISVRHGDRELEFFEVQDFLNDLVERWPYDLGPRSCEQMGKEIAEELLARYGNDRYVTVSILEDGENGGTVAWRPELPVPLFQ